MLSGKHLLSKNNNPNQGVGRIKYRCGPVLHS